MCLERTDSPNSPRVATPHHTVHMCNCESSLRANGITRFYPFIFFLRIVYTLVTVWEIYPLLLLLLSVAPPPPTAFRRKQNGSDLSQYRYEFLSPLGCERSRRKIPGYCEHWAYHPLTTIAPRSLFHCSGIKHLSAATFSSWFNWESNLQTLKEF